MRKLFIILLSLGLSLPSVGQTIEDVDDIPLSNPRKDRPFGVNGLIGGEEVIPAIGIEYYVLPDLEISYAFGTLLQMAGLEYHILGMRDKYATPFIGARYLSLEDEDRGTTNNGFYFPIGFQYMAPSGWLVSAEIGPLTHKNLSANPIFLGIGIGYHFNGLRWRK